jgi:hypothetical protein
VVDASRSALTFRLLGRCLDDCTSNSANAPPLRSSIRLERIQRPTSGLALAKVEMIRFTL